MNKKFIKSSSIVLLSLIFGTQCLSDATSIQAQSFKTIATSESNSSSDESTEPTSSSSSSDESTEPTSSSSSSDESTEPTSSSSSSDESTEPTSSSSSSDKSTTEDQNQDSNKSTTEQIPDKSLLKKDLPRIPIKLSALPVKHPGASPFHDISNSLFKNYINWIYSRGITTGYTPSTYNPNAQVTRGEMAVFLYRLASSPSYRPPFNIYNDISLYKNQILWLTATNVTNGTAPHYNPNGAVTRGQMAAFLHRIAKASGLAPSSGTYNTKFWDTKNNMFKNDIGWLSSTGITTGYTATYFKPDAPITRGEMAAFLYRFYSVEINHQKLPPAPQPHASEPTYYSQLDSRWSGIPLNNSNVGVSGCVATSLAMILRGSYGKNVDPGSVARTANNISHQSFGLSGTDLIKTSKAYGHDVEVIKTQKRADDLLRAGYPLIFFINVGVGHAVVVYGDDNGVVNVNDPYGRRFYPNGRTTLSELWGRPSQDSMDWDAGRPVFAIK